MTSALAIFLTLGAAPPAPVPSAAAPSETPFTCDLTEMRRRHRDVAATAIENPVVAAEWVRWYEQAARRFPFGTFAREVKRVYLAESATLGGNRIAGLALVNEGAMILAVGGKTTDQLLRDFHHETAHLLYDGHPRKFPTKAWLAANAPDFRYLYRSGREALAVEAVSIAFDPALAEKGLVSQYGASCLMEDVAMAAETLMVGYDGDEKEVVALARTYPRLGAKFGLLVDFYRAIFPGIWFPKLPPGATTPPPAPPASGPSGEKKDGGGKGGR